MLKEMLRTIFAPSAPRRATGLSNYQLNQLANYNSEAARGLIHHEAWHRQMQQLQEIFNRSMYLGDDPQH